MTVDLGQACLNSELKMMLEESEKKISEIIKGFLKDIVKNKKAGLGVMKSSTSSVASTSKAEHLLYLQGLIGPIKVKVFIDTSISSMNSRAVAEPRMKALADKRYIVTLAEGSECYTQGYIDVHVSLAAELKYLVRLHIIDFSTFDVSLGDNWQRQACANSGFYKSLEVLVKRIAIDGRRFLESIDLQAKISLYSEINKVEEVVDGELYDRKEESSSIPEGQENLHQLTDAHLLVPKVIPEHLWRQGTLNDVQNEELLITPFPNIPEDTFLDDQIPPVISDEEDNQVLGTKLEESDLNDKQKQSLLSLLSHYSDVSIDGITGLLQTPLLIYKIGLCADSL